MPVPFFDNSISFGLASFLSGAVAGSGLIITGVFSIISILVAVFSESYGARRAFIIISVFLVALTGICVSWTVTKRYSRTDIENGSIDPRYTYFGQTKNGYLDGFGKLFDEEGNIVYVGHFVSGEKSGQGRQYKTAGDGTVFLNLEGEFENGLLNGEGIDRIYLNGEERIVYQGGFKNAEYDGYGQQFFYDNDGRLVFSYDGEYKDGERNGFGVYTEYSDGEMTSIYDGGWAYGKRYGYGVQTSLDESGVIAARYSGTYWNDKKWGIGVDEYERGGHKMIVYGRFDDDAATSDSCVYDEEGYPYYAVLNNTRMKVYEDGTVTNDEYEGEVVDYQNDEEALDRLVSVWPYPGTNIWIEREET